MKKKHLIVVAYAIYILTLFGLSSYYQYLDELPTNPGFFSDFGKGLKYALNYFLCCFFGSWIFFVILNFIYKKLSIAFVFCTPFLLFFVGLIVHLAADFVLWISQTGTNISDFQKAFLVTTISATLIMIWFFGDVFSKNEDAKTF